MEMGGGGGVGGVVAVVMKMAVVAAAAALLCAECREPVLHKVGGQQGWKTGVNYTNWSKSETFYVGDWLYFIFDKNQYNVLEVNETSYEQCIDQNFITNVTKGGKDVFNLTEARPYYFLSGRGFCFSGVKLAVPVRVPPPPSPPPAPAKSGSPSSHTPGSLGGGLAYYLIAGTALGLLLR
ncbi:early nodulin-like protein 19 [Malania oleifera]|uniref:early nodulin-like protein 19 n=1 Tax=Malania oleifera TaxID=397392 RepID=UPI0025AE3DD1|nr:early nodulin-like protein 19 [Malania oleifera]